jgi:hypothetical protein
MKGPENLTVYWLPIDPAPWGIYGLDEIGELYLNPNIISLQCHRKASCSRSLSFLKVGEGFGGPGIVGIVPMKWIRDNSGESIETLNELEGLVRKFIGVTEAHLCPCAHVSLPGEPAFTDAVLRTLAGNKN